MALRYNQSKATRCISSCSAPLLIKHPFIYTIDSRCCSCVTIVTQAKESYLQEKSAH